MSLTTVASSDLENIRVASPARTGASLQLDLQKFISPSQQKLSYQRHRNTKSLFVKIVNTRTPHLKYKLSYMEMTTIEINVEADHPLLIQIIDADRNILWLESGNRLETTVSDQNLELTLSQPEKQDFTVSQVTIRKLKSGLVLSHNNLIVRLPINVFDDLIQDNRMFYDQRFRDKRRFLLSTYLVDPSPIRKEFLRLNDIDTPTINQQIIPEDLCQIREEIIDLGKTLSEIRSEINELNNIITNTTITTHTNLYLIDQNRRLDILSTIKQRFLQERKLVEYFLLFPSKIESTESSRTIIENYLKTIDNHILKQDWLTENLNADLTRLFDEEEQRLLAVNEHQENINRLNDLKTEYLETHNILQQRLNEERDKTLVIWNAALESIER